MNRQLLASSLFLLTPRRLQSGPVSLIERRPSLLFCILLLFTACDIAQPIAARAQTIQQRHFTWYYMNTKDAAGLNRRDWYEKPDGSWQEVYPNGLTGNFNVVSEHVKLQIMANGQNVFATGKVVEKSDKALVAFIPDHLESGQWLQWKAPGDVSGPWQHAGEIVTTASDAVLLQPKFTQGQAPPAAAADRSTATLDQTFAWIRQYVTTYGGTNVNNVRRYGSSGWNILTGYDDVLRDSNAPCVFIMKGFEDSQGVLDNSFKEDSGRIHSRRKTKWTITLPLYYLKSAAAIHFASPYVDNGVQLTFEGAKVVFQEDGTYEPNLVFDIDNTYRSVQTVSVAESRVVQTLLTGQDSTADNADIAARLARAFTHAATLCANSKPTSNEPF